MLQLNFACVALSSVFVHSVQRNLLAAVRDGRHGWVDRVGIDYRISTDSPHRKRYIYQGRIIFNDGYTTTRFGWQGNMPPKHGLALITRYP